MDPGPTPAFVEPAGARLETERLRVLVASLGMGVLVEDAARRVSLVNQPFCEMFQIPTSSGDLLGADCAEAARRSAALVREPEVFLARIEQVLAGHVPVTGDEICFRDGRVLERDYTPIVVDSVESGHLWVYRDATRLHQEAGLRRAAEDDHKRAEALLAGEKRLLELLARGSSLSVVLDALCLLVEDNAPGCRCGILLVDPTGSRLEHGAGPSLPDAYNGWVHGQPVTPSSGPCAMAAAIGTQVIASDIAADERWAASGWRELASSHGLGACWSTPILSVDDKVLGTFAIYQNRAGDPSSLHQELIEQFTHLASVVIERKRSEDALQHAQAELFHVTRVTMLGEIAASIAHEINQPLTAMVADASACLGWLTDRQPDLANARESLTAIINDGARAGQILRRIRSLLARSTAIGEAGHVRCDLRAVIHGALELVRPELARQRTVLGPVLGPEGVAIMGDAIELQQVVVNLVLNATEAAKGLGPERRRVAIRWSLQQREGSPWALVAVEDAGVGIDEQESDRLFAAFYSTKPGGLGMGLSIIRSIINRHGGRTWGTANAEHGATFSFELPALS